MIDLDLDVYNECKAINTRQDDGEAIIYMRSCDGKVSFVFSVFDGDSINLLINCMKQDDELCDYVFEAVSEIAAGERT